jgi:AcrR family transcriptional regulator
MGRKKKYGDNREVLLATADQLFQQFGFNKTTMEDIAQAASLGKSAIYSEFASKDELLLAVVERFASNNRARMQAIADRADLPGASCLCVLHQVLLDLTLTVHDHASTRVRSHEITSPFQALQPHLELQQHALRRRIEEEDVGLIASLLEKAAQRAEIPKPADYRAAACAIRQAMMSLFPPVSIVRRLTRQALEQEADLLLSLLLGGLRNPNPSQRENLPASWERSD